MENQAVVAMFGDWPVCKAGAVERPKKPFAGPVAGENPACAVTTVSRRGETQNKEPPVCLAEGRNWSSPVFLKAERCSFLMGNPLAPLDETRAQSTELDLRIQA